MPRDIIDALVRRTDAQINRRLLGVARGGRINLDPPSGFLNQLRQGHVEYDSAELAVSTGASSLEDNLNHIRYRLVQIETGGSVVTSIATSGSPQVRGDIVYVKGANVDITQTGGSFTFATTSAVVSYENPLDVAAAAVVGTSGSAAHGDHAHRGVTSITKDSAAYGAIQVIEGSGISISQSSGSFTFANSQTDLSGEPFVTHAATGNLSNERVFAYSDANARWEPTQPIKVTSGSLFVGDGTQTSYLILNHGQTGTPTRDAYIYTDRGSSGLRTLWWWDETADRLKTDAAQFTGTIFGISAEFTSSIYLDAMGGVWFDNDIDGGLRGIFYDNTADAVMIDVSNWQTTYSDVVVKLGQPTGGSTAFEVWNSSGSVRFSVDDDGNVWYAGTHPAANSFAEDGRLLYDIESPTLQQSIADLYSLVEVLGRENARLRQRIEMVESRLH